MGQDDRKWVLVMVQPGDGHGDEKEADRADRVPCLARDAHVRVHTPCIVCEGGRLFAAVETPRAA